MPHTPRTRFANIIFRAIFTTLGAVAEIFAVSLVFDIANPLFFIAVAIFLISIAYLWDFYRDYHLQLTKPHRFTATTFIIALIASFFGILFLKNKVMAAIIFVAFIFLEFIYNKYIYEIASTVWISKDIVAIIFWNLFIFIFLAYSGVSSIISILYFLIFVLSRDLVNIAYCDIKDISLDQLNRLKTFATLLGARTLVDGLTMINIFSILWLVLGVALGLLPMIALFLIVPVVITGTLIFMSRSSKVYSSTTVDFEYYVWLLSMMIGKLLV